MFGFGLALRGRVADIAQAVLAVHIRRVHCGVQQGRCATGKHRDIDAHHVADLQRVGDGVRQADVAGSDRQADDLVPRIVEGHQQGEGVIHAGIGVDEQGDALVSHGVAWFSLMGSRAAAW